MLACLHIRNILTNELTFMDSPKVLRYAIYEPTVWLCQASGVRQVQSSLRAWRVLQ